MFRLLFPISRAWLREDAGFSWLAPQQPCWIYYSYTGGSGAVIGCYADKSEGQQSPNAGIIYRPLNKH